MCWYVNTCLVVLYSSLHCISPFSAVLRWAAVQCGLLLLVRPTMLCYILTCCGVFYCRCACYIYNNLGHCEVETGKWLVSMKWTNSSVIVDVIVRVIIITIACNWNRCFYVALFLTACVTVCEKFNNLTVGLYNFMHVLHSLPEHCLVKLQFKDTTSEQRMISVALLLLPGFQMALPGIGEFYLQEIIRQALYHVDFVTCATDV